MNCLNPIFAWYNGRTKSGKRRVVFVPPMADLSPSQLSLVDGVKPQVVIPCGKCVLCRDNQRKQWVNRLIAETFDNVASFLTLTIDDDHYLPPIKKPIQDFLKRFRITCSRRGIDLSRFKYFFVNEFGSKSLRLHYHAVIFGLDLLRDSRFGSYLATHKKDKRGRVYPVYASRFIEDVWPYGFNSVDRCTDKSIRYVAKYCAKSSFEFSDSESKSLLPQWHLYSRRIGTRFFVSGKSLTPFGRQVFTSGKLLLNRDGFPSRPPKFLDRYAELYEPDLFKAVKASRRAFARCVNPNHSCITGRAEMINRTMADYKRNEIL